MRISTVAILLALPVQLPAAVQFMPLAPGNTWVYRAANTEQTHTIRVGLNPLIMHDGRVYHRVTGYTPEPLWIRAGESGDLYYFDDDLDRDLLLTSFQPADRYWVHAPKRECDQELQPQSRPVDHEGPGGYFSSALLVSYRSFGCGDAGIQEEQYVQNIGMVRRVVTTIAGSVTYNLVHATLGTVTVSERPAGSFRLSLRRLTDRVIATLRLSVDGGLPIRLAFPTSQEFEIVLRDGSGQEVWRWSNGLAFAQAVHEKTVIELTHTAEIPLLEFGRPLREGTYTVEAWLTTEPRQFATAAVLEIRGPEVSDGPDARQ